MKTTLDISDSLLREARKIAVRTAQPFARWSSRACARSSPSGKLRAHFGCAK
jgi:hypothetical protein